MTHGNTLTLHKLGGAYRHKTNDWWYEASVDGGEHFRLEYESVDDYMRCFNIKKLKRIPEQKGRTA